MQAMRGAHRGDHAVSSPRVVIYSTILVASLVPPVYLVVRSFLHRDARDAVVAVVCGVLYLLVLSRLWDVASFQRRAMVRERTLRLGGGRAPPAPWAARRGGGGGGGGRRCGRGAAAAGCARSPRFRRPRPRPSPTSRR